MLGVGGGRIQDRDLESRASSVICEFLEPLSLKSQLKERLRGQSPASSDYRDCTHSDLSSVAPPMYAFLLSSGSECAAF